MLRLRAWLKRLFRRDPPISLGVELNRIVFVPGLVRAAPSEEERISFSDVVTPLRLVHAEAITSVASLEAARAELERMDSEFETFMAGLYREP